MIKGKEYASPNSYGIVDYCGRFSDECRYSLADDERTGRAFKKIPDSSRYIKSEDILYEIKKIEQKRVLSDGMVYDYVQKGLTKDEAEKYLQTKEGSKQIGYIMYGQEKYSNGEN